MSGLSQNAEGWRTTIFLIFSVLFLALYGMSGRLVFWHPDANVQNFVISTRAAMPPEPVHCNLTTPQDKTSQASDYSDSDPPVGFYKKAGYLSKYPEVINEAELHFSSLASAAEICRQINDCGGVTLKGHVRRQKNQGTFELRRGPLVTDGQNDTVSWVFQPNPADCPFSPFITPEHVLNNREALLSRSCQNGVEHYSGNFEHLNGLVKVSLSEYISFHLIINSSSTERSITHAY